MFLDVLDCKMSEYRLKPSKQDFYVGNYVPLIEDRGDRMGSEEHQHRSPDSNPNPSHQDLPFADHPVHCLLNTARPGQHHPCGLRHFPADTQYHQYMTCNFNRADDVNVPVYQSGDRPGTDCRCGRNPVFINLCSVNEIYGSANLQGFY